ncbi:MAG TPA: hypothetical protein VIH45_12295, partial [Desulfuromonadaceae bacterium]
MSDRYIEKSFLWLLVVSLLLHVGVFTLLYYLPETKQPPPKEPVFVDLQNIPDLKPLPPTQQEVKRFSEQRTRVERETAPRGESPRETAPVPPRPPAARPQPSPQQRETGRAGPTETPLAPGSSISSLLRPQRQTAP